MWRGGEGGTSTNRVGYANFSSGARARQANKPFFAFNQEVVLPSSSSTFESFFRWHLLQLGEDLLVVGGHGGVGDEKDYEVTLLDGLVPGFQDGIRGIERGSHMSRHQQERDARHDTS